MTNNFSLVHGKLAEITSWVHVLNWSRFIALVFWSLYKHHLTWKPMTCTQIKLAVSLPTISNFPFLQSESNFSIIINICPSSPQCLLRSVWCWILISLTLSGYMGFSCASVSSCYYISSPAFLSPPLGISLRRLRVLCLSSSSYLISDLESQSLHTYSICMTIWVYLRGFMNSTWKILISELNCSWNALEESALRPDCILFSDEKELGHSFTSH